MKKFLTGGGNYCLWSYYPSTFISHFVKMQVTKEIFYSLYPFVNKIPDFIQLIPENIQEALHLFGEKSLKNFFEILLQRLEEN